jgi:small redox-active disulfide protein 2
MLNVKVIGPGCANCDHLMHIVENAVEELRVEKVDLEVQVEKVTDMTRFLDYGVLTTPGLVVNKTLVSAGKVPALTQIKAWLIQALEEDALE